MVISRLSSLSHRYLLLSFAIIGSALAGWVVVRPDAGPQVAFMLPFIPLAIAILRNPELGMALGFLAFILIPYDAIRVPLPVLDSPVALLWVITAAAGCIRFVLKRKSILPTVIYYPIALCVVLIATNLALGQGPDTGLRLYLLLLSLWPLAMVVLLVETPQQARRFLLSAIVPVALLVLFWVPVMIGFTSFGQNPAGLLRTTYNRSFAEQHPVLAFLKPGGVIATWVVLMVAPVFLSVGLSSDHQRRRGVARLIYLLCATYVFLSTFVASIGAFVVETVLVIILVRWVVRPGGRSYLYLALLAIAVFLASTLTGADREIRERFQLQFAPEAATGRSDRQMAYEADIQLAMKYSLTGIGAYQRSGDTTPAGEIPQGHSFWLEAAYEFGLFYVLAWGAIMYLTCRQCWHLLCETPHREEQAVLAGILAALVTVVLLSIVNPVLNSSGPTEYFWLFAGLIALWSHWRRQGPQASLLGLIDDKRPERLPSVVHRQPSIRGNNL